MNKLIAFEMQVRNVEIASLLATRVVSKDILVTKKFLQIRASISEVGVIEPLSISQPNKKKEQYALLDGHLRLAALKSLEKTHAPCLLSNDDEAFTYNNRVNRLSTIQENAMLVNALKRGVSEDALGRALNVEPRVIKTKAYMMEGVCDEALHLLRDRIFSYDVTRALRKMKPVRQVEAVELMLSANAVTIGYAEAILAATPASMLVIDAKKKIRGLTTEQMSKMENEMGNVQEQFKLIEHTYGQDVLNMVLAKGFVSKLLSNKQTARFLKMRYKDVFAEFEEITRTANLDE